MFEISRNVIDSPKRIVNPNLAFWTDASTVVQKLIKYISISISCTIHSSLKWGRESSLTGLILGSTHDQIVL